MGRNESISLDNYTKFLFDRKLIPRDMKASEAFTNEYLPK